MELFDLVENTPQNFYELMGVDEKASASDIRKAYRKLSTLYHPDKNKNSNAEETFRTLAAVADVLRNDERRKMYDLILKTGLPDWRAPIYYYRRVRNMGLIEMTIFLLCLSTLGQYLFAWSSYLEKKYEIEEVVLSKVRRKAKHQRKGKNAKIEEEAIVSEVMSDLQKPRCQDLFPVRLFYFVIHLIKSSPSYIASCRNILKFRKVEEEEEIESEGEDERPQFNRVKNRKTVKPKIPDFTNIPSYDAASNISSSVVEETLKEELKPSNLKWNFETLSEQQMIDFKKALKKFPNGTLQRWEKVSACLGCSVNEVVAMVKMLKNQQFSNGVPVSLQGVTGTEKENFGTQLYEAKDNKLKNGGNMLTERKSNNMNSNNTSNTISDKQVSSCMISESDKLWKQEEQRSLEEALQKFPKDTPARWDKIANFISTKTKEECIERYKILAQQVRLKKGKAL